MSTLKPDMARWDTMPAAERNALVNERLGLPGKMKPTTDESDCALAVKAWLPHAKLGQTMPLLGPLAPSDVCRVMLEALAECEVDDA